MCFRKFHKCDGFFSDESDFGKSGVLREKGVQYVICHIHFQVLDK